MKRNLMILFWAASLLPAQDADRITVPLSDPSRPATIRVDLMNGDVSVRGYSGRDVIVEMKGSDRAARRRKAAAEVEGLKRIDIGGGGMDVEERENVIRINSGPRGSGDVTVQVPQSAALRLKTMTGTVTVDGVQGEIEANSMNGPVRITNADGAVIAHSLNGNVVVSVNKISEKPMSFSTMNGDIDVTMPADAKARLKLKNDHGEVYSDFEMKLEATPKMEGGRREDGKYKVKFERTVTGTINGGGPEISFTTLNGQIRIRQKK